MYMMEEKKKDQVCFDFGQLSIPKYNAKKGGQASQAQPAMYLKHNQNSNHKSQHFFVII